MAEQNPEQPAENAAAQPSEPGQARPARREPAVQVAEEMLNERGERTATHLERIAGDAAVESGGRDEMPWVRVEPDRLPALARRCRDDAVLKADMLHCLLAVDYVDHIELDYVLFGIGSGHRLLLKTSVPADNPVAPTLTHLWEAAAWYEREAHDLFGVTFEGNDDLEPLLLFEGFEGHPGLKSFPLHEYDEW